MKKILQQLFEHEPLSRQEAHAVMQQIAENAFSDPEIAALITVYLMRSITIDELQGFRDALMEQVNPVDLKGQPVLDMVGTGGDGKNTFNISTLSCFIVAGAGVKVAKHGNYAASSVSGSSNVLEQLGYKFSKRSEDLLQELEAANICFLHAPLFHPALKQVAHIRKSLGFRSFFNMLGPLVNPAHPQYQMIGVYNLEMARFYNYMLQAGSTEYSIVHGLDGYDEIALTGDTRVITRKGERTFSAAELGKRTVTPADIYGGNSIAEAAKIFLQILQGKGSWAQNAVVLANAAMALECAGAAANYDDCYQLAIESLESGRAYSCLQTLTSMKA